VPEHAPATVDELDELERRIDEWLAGVRATNPLVDAVERGEPGERRWYVRMLGETRDAFTIYLTLRQRSLHHETFFLPAPPKNSGALYEHLLRRNTALRGVHFAIGEEAAILLVGQEPIDRLDTDVLDVILGTHYDAVERCFRAALQIGFVGPTLPEPA
jgi:hypothetical protein